MGNATPWGMGANGKLALERVVIFTGGKATVQTIRGVPDPLIREGVTYRRTAFQFAEGSALRFVYAEFPLTLDNKGEAMTAFRLDAERDAAGGC